MNITPCALLVFRLKDVTVVLDFIAAPPAVHFRTIFRHLTLSPNIPALRSLFMRVTVKQTL